MMTSRITSDPYLSAVTLNQFKEQNAERIEKEARTNPGYSVKGVVRPSYDILARYARRPRAFSCSWMGRKIMHLPGACLSAVKFSYHLSKAFTYDALTAPCRKTRTFRVDVYRAGRDLQEVRGHLLGMLSENVGRYALEESAFYKKIYEIMELPGTAPEIESFAVPRLTRISQLDSIDGTSPNEILKMVLKMDSAVLCQLKFTKEQLQAIPLGLLSQDQLNGLFPAYMECSPRNESNTDPLIEDFNNLHANRNVAKKAKLTERLMAYTPAQIGIVLYKLAPEVMLCFLETFRIKTVDLGDFLIAPWIISESLFEEVPEQRVRQRMQSIQVPLLQELLSSTAVSDKVKGIITDELEKKKNPPPVAEEASPARDRVTELRGTIQNALFGGAEVSDQPTEAVNDAEKQTTLLQKIYHLAVYILKTTWLGARVVFTCVTYPIWKSYQLFTNRFFSSMPNDSASALPPLPVPPQFRDPDALPSVRVAPPPLVQGKPPPLSPQGMPPPPKKLPWMT